ncbi:benzoyl-CoA reductase/2-hydroxyglutaryl-CoA dehydratase subunit BcrC/BadD/HgdB [Bradyrhizobium sp. CIR18]|nr:benzoyl-CoA reductase/2-hydroxyglutaryl-CoA dehydratase subunit BcrC/BadD/HgdB [Bradyrhizobium sp. CIR18]
MASIKIREDRVRRQLAKRDMRLCKTPARSWLRAFYSPGYMVVDHRNVVISACGTRQYDASLEDVERFAFGPR